MAWGEPGFGSLSDRLCHGQVVFCLRSVSAALACLFLFGLVSARTPSAFHTPKAPARIGRADIVFVEASTVASGDLSQRFPQGSRLVRLRPGVESAPLAILTPSFFAAADPQPSSDDAKVVFSGQKASGERWQVWEMNADGSGQHQVTNCQADCLRPAYLPNDEIAYTEASVKEGRAVSHLMVSKTNGSDARRITFGPGDFQVETVLRNGLILISASWPLRAEGEATASRQFYTIRPDGTALESFRC